MNVAEIMDALAERLATIDGMAGATAHPVDAVSVTPWAVVSYPSVYNFDATYDRGHDDTALPVVVVVGRTKDTRAVREALSAFLDGEGNASVKEALEAEPLPDGIDAVRVMSVEVTPVTIGGTDYVAAVFDVEIDG